MMRHFIFYIILSCWLAGCQSPNNTPAPGGKPAGDSTNAGYPDSEKTAIPQNLDTASIIQNIKEEFARINNTSLIKKKIDWENDTTCEAPPMGGSVTYFYEKDNLVKIISEGDEDHGEWNEAYYFKEGQLFFIFQNNAYGGAANPTYYKYQNRYYLHNGKLITKIETRGSTGLNEKDLDELLKEIEKLKVAKISKEISRIFSCGE